LPPREYVAEKGGRYDQEKKENSSESGLYIYVTPIIYASPYVPIQTDEKETRSIGVHAAQKPARVNVPEDVPD